MRMTLACLALLSGLVLPASAQDFLKPLEELVETIAPRRAPPAQPAPAAPKPDPQAVEATENPPPIPRPRPETLEDEAAEQPAGAVDVDAETPAEPAPAEPEPEVAAPPPETPGRVYQGACPALLRGDVVGDMLEPIAEGICGERSPLSITAVNVNGRQIAFSGAVITNCAMAGALADWVGAVDAYANAALDSPIATLETGTSMMCRGRNGNDEADLSEHGFANALDVTGFTLADGRTIRVEADWLPASSPQAKLLRQAHGAACGRFTTVLGPEANDAHEDHFHLDLGCHGKTCTAQICE
jgi:hypothetical protein